MLHLATFYKQFTKLVFLVAPTLSIGSVLLQQTAIQASFHYRNVEIVESRPHPDANQLANNLSDLGQLYNKEDLSTDVAVSCSTLFFFLSQFKLQSISIL